MPPNTPLAISKSSAVSSAVEFTSSPAMMFAWDAPG